MKMKGFSPLVWYMIGFILVIAVVLILFVFYGRVFEGAKSFLFG